MQRKLFQKCTHLLYCSGLSLGGNFQYVRSVYTTAINFPCITPLLLTIFICKMKMGNKYKFFDKNFVDFQNLLTIKFCWRQIFEILIIHKPSLGSRVVPHKIWSRSVQPFCRLLNTNKQTPRQAK